MAKVNYMDRDNVLREYELTDEAIDMFFVSSSLHLLANRFT